MAASPLLDTAPLDTAPLDTAPLSSSPLDPARRGATPRASRLLERSTTPQLVADVLRDQMLRGELPPGTQVAEHQLSGELGVSRNTLREGFQILLGERLLVREPHRGVFVRRLSVEDLRDIFAFRRLVECAAIADPVEPRGVVLMRAAVEDARLAASRGDWNDVATADIRFHEGVTAAGGSARLDRVVRALFAELRLAFQLVGDPRALHEPFLPLNAELAELSEAGRSAHAGVRLRSYLDRAETVLVDALEGG